MPTNRFLSSVPHGIDDEAIPHSIEAMAAERLPLIMKAQPEGPYRLCGNCLGGIVAFEVARLLVAAGKEVEMVCMIDPPTINSNKIRADVAFDNEVCAAIPWSCRRSRDGVDMV